MKLIYVSRSIIPSRTANSVHVMRMCQAFSKLGHEVTLLAPISKKLEEKNISDIHEYYGTDKTFEIKKLYIPNIKFIKKPWYSWKCLAEIKKIQPDIVYGRNDLRALWWSVKNHFLTGIEQHMPPANDTEKKYLNQIMSHKSGKKLVVISEALAQKYCADYNIKQSEILIAHDGADEINDLSIPNSVKSNPDKKNIGYIGSLFKGRGIDLIIALAAKLPECDFHIIGGDQKDIQYWKSHTNLNNLLFHGFVPPKEAYKYRNMCDVLIAPYQTSQEGNHTSQYMSPIKLFEYMSSSKPIICSDLPVVREILNEDNSVLVDPYDITQWIDAIQKILHNEEFSKTLAAAALYDFTTHYTWTERARRIVNFILQGK